MKVSYYFHFGLIAVNADMDLDLLSYFFFWIIILEFNTINSHI